MAERNLPLSSNLQPGPRLLAALHVAFSICFWAIVAVCVATLLVWGMPVLRPFMPYAWDAMKADTAIVLLLAVYSLRLSQPGLSARKHALAHGMAAAVLVIALVGGVECLTGLPVGLASLLRLLPQMHTLLPMPPHVALAMTFFGFVLAFLRARKSLLSRIVDFCAIAMIFTMAVFVSGFFFHALGLFGAGRTNHVSLQTTICLSALCFFAFTRRAEYGIFSIFLGEGIGSRLARTATPFALALPFAVISTRDFIVARTMFEPHYASAIATSTTSLLAFVLIYILSRRIDHMEREIRILSLNDELTGLYNRRGFYLLAQQTYALAQRSGNDFCVLFIDVDGLKQVNDKQGHEVGDEMLKEMALLLQAGFRESDVLGRLGGDEFAIAARGTILEMNIVARRLEEITARSNAVRDRNFQLSYSWGYACAKPGSKTSLDLLLQEADLHMYDRKRSKKEAAMGMPSIVPVSS